MKLEFHPKAEMELIEQAAHYELQVPGLGASFAAEVRRATDILLEYPEIGPAATADLRTFALNRFPFTLYDSVTPDALRIEVVAHQRRGPSFLQSRMDR
jgi:plasmid stabilization system protein ParE